MGITANNATRGQKPSLLLYREVDLGCREERTFLEAELLKLEWATCGGSGFLVPMNIQEWGPGVREGSCSGRSGPLLLRCWERFGCPGP